MTRTYPRKRRTWPIVAAVGALGLCLLGTVAAIASTGDKHGTHGEEDRQGSRADRRLHVEARWLS